MYLRTVKLKNTGPVESFDVALPFEGDQPKPVLLVGKNGSGKSTVISFVVNAIVGMKQHVFDDIEVDKGRVYRIRSPLAINGAAEFYFARLTFDQGVVLTEWQLNRPRSEYPDHSHMRALDPAWDHFPAHETSAFSLNMGDLTDARRMEEMLDKTCLLYFPADRFEPPDWLNTADLSSDLKLPEPERIKGKTGRRIFSRNRLKPTLDWLNSVIFDMMVVEHQETILPIAMRTPEGSNSQQGSQLVPVRIKTPGKAHVVFASVQEVLRKVLCERDTDTLSFGIGDRKSRIINANVARDGKPIKVIKDLMSLSAGESALFCMFASIVRDADLSSMAFNSPGDIEGLVVIDEADMHLHVGLQYRALPELIALFPKVQFIISAHAPLVAIGLEKKLGGDGFEIIDLPSATRIPSESYSEFQEAFDAFSKSKAFHDEILMAIRTTPKPILLFEGKSDSQLIASAWLKLKPGEAMPFDVMPCGIEPDEEKRSGGASMLRRTLEFLSAVIDGPLCGIFDFDRAGYEGFAGLNKHVFSVGIDAEHKRHAVKSVHALLLPVPPHRSDFVNSKKPIHSFMSIEHYFADDVLKTGGFHLTPVIAGSTVFEIDGPPKQKIAFANAAVGFDAIKFTNFQVLFDRLKSIGFI